MINLHKGILPILSTSGFPPPPENAIPDPRFIETPSSMLAQALSRTAPRRPRGEKKAIPDEQKDERYYERRKRNNLAAKKSRDQRKMREDAIAMRASFLEKENAVLRTQVLALREERNSLQGLIVRKQLAQKQKEMLNLVAQQQHLHILIKNNLNHWTSPVQTKKPDPEIVVDLTVKKEDEKHEEDDIKVS